MEQPAQPTRRVSVMTPCYNEEANVREVYAQVKRVFESLPQYTYEHLFIDNASEDATVEILRELAAADPNVKVIVNVRNFGHIRSPHHGLLQATGEAVMTIVADLQDPPEMIREFLAQWESGYAIVVGVKKASHENGLVFRLRRLYYSTLQRLSETTLIENFTGFGLYDQKVIAILRELRDPYPYFRGLIAELGFPCAKIEYVQPSRQRGITKNNFYTLYDMAMLGLTSHSKVPLRLATMLGFLAAGLSLCAGLFYFVYKLVFWNDFRLGQAPVVVGMYFLGSVQLLFLGIVGEYVGAIHTQMLRRPLVVEKERINF